jgi:O-methyltransferase involved in polyketide biosynthesis
MPGVRFTENQSTNLATLYGRALDARAEHPVLADKTAEEAVSKIDYDFAKFGIGASEAFSIASRGKTFDDVVRGFIAQHDESTVVHLGAGMDSRVYRIDPPATVRWFDVDFPAVIELRRQIYPARQNTTMLGASVTDPDWLATVPADRPTLVIAEGMSMYLTEEQGHALFRGVTGHFPSGEVFFDAYSRFGIRTQKANKVVRRAKVTLHWGIDDPNKLAAAAGLTLAERRTAGDFVHSADMAKLPRIQQWIYGVVLRLPKVRDMGQLLRYRF